MALLSAVGTLHQPLMSSNIKRSIKLQASGDTMDMLLDEGKGSCFLNMKSMEKVANTNDLGKLAEAEAAAEDAGEVMKQFGDLLKSRRRVIDGQRKVSAYIKYMLIILPMYKLVEIIIFTNVYTVIKTLINTHEIRLL